MTYPSVHAATRNPSAGSTALGSSAASSAPGSPSTEAELFDAVLELARHHRWAIHFCRPGVNTRPASRSWRAGTTGHVGFPDLVLARAGVVLLRKLRSERGRLTPEQRDWGAQLGDLWAVWRPHQWDQIVAELTEAVDR